MRLLSNYFVHTVSNLRYPVGEYLYFIQRGASGSGIHSSIMYQLTRNLSEKDICESPFASYFVDHTTGVYTVSAAGVPFDTKYLAVKGDPIADLNEDLAADAAMLQKQHDTFTPQNPL